jgi:hypothetical protein
MRRQLLAALGMGVTMKEYKDETSGVQILHLYYGFVWHMIPTYMTAPQYTDEFVKRSITVNDDAKKQHLYFLCHRVPHIKV